MTMASDAIKLRIGNRLGPYCLTRKLGAGGGGPVWLVEDTEGLDSNLLTVDTQGTGEEKKAEQLQFALKVCLDLEDPNDPVLLRDVQREIENWITLSNKKHPNILPVIRPAIYENLVVLISEYAPNGTLRDWILSRKDDKRAVEWEQAVLLMDGILSGLAFAHSYSIVHRDIKPENVVLQGDTTSFRTTLPRLMDFGLSRIQTHSVITSRAVGTPEYMPPESASGTCTPQWDIWSAGVLFQELLTGEGPVPTPSDNEQIPDLLRVIIAKAMKRERMERWSTVEEMRLALQEAATKLRQRVSQQQAESEKLLSAKQAEADQLLEAKHAYDQKDYTLAFALFYPLAKKGNREAKCYLGFLYEYGRCVERNFAEAHRWYLEAAHMGDDRAMNNLGGLYYQGRGVKQNLPTALEWYREAARAGNEKAKAALRHLEG